MHRYSLYSLLITIIHHFSLLSLLFTIIHHYSLLSLLFIIIHYYHYYLLLFIIIHCYHYYSSLFTISLLFTIIIVRSVPGSYGRHFFLQNYSSEFAERSLELSQQTPYWLGAGYWEGQLRRKPLKVATPTSEPPARVPPKKVKNSQKSQFSVIFTHPPAHLRRRYALVSN